MVIKLKTKADIREELEREINRFIQTGGHIEDVASGVSGRETNHPPHYPTPLNPDKQERTPLTKEIQALEARKQKPKQQKTAPKKPKKRVITDDFGEPLRWVWED